jgi:hypothetical protein
MCESVRDSHEIPFSHHTRKLIDQSFFYLRLQFSTLEAGEPIFTLVEVPGIGIKMTVSFGDLCTKENSLSFRILHKEKPRDVYTSFLFLF